VKRSRRRISRREMLERTFVVGAFAPQLASASPGAAERWRVGCYTRPWAQHEYRVALDAIAEAGFRHVGLMTTKSPSNLVISVDTAPEEARKVGEECGKRNLSLASLYGGDIPVAESLAAGIAGMRRLIDNCVAAGIGNLMMGGVTDVKLVEPYYRAIVECCGYAGEKGIGISVKPHGGTNATGPQCRRLIESVGHSNFRLWYDPANIFYYSDGKIDPVDDSATVDGLVVGMSVKDFRMPKDVDLTPGTGMVNFPKVMANLKRGGFTGGPLIIECLAPGDLPQLLANARKARAFVESLVSGLA
jgi:sugar phosphate isomerase/epimerase